MSNVSIDTLERIK